MITPAYCPQCNLDYCRGLEADEKEHRRRHRQIIELLKPRPIPAFRKAQRAAGAIDLRVTIDSPAWVHRRLYRVALAFKREMKFDFIQWGDPDTDPAGVGYLLGDDTGLFGAGAIIGGCAFRWREWDGHPKGWALQWVWIAPPARRQGVLTRRWEGFARDFGDFLSEPPISPAMIRFLEKVAAQQQGLLKGAKRDRAA